MSKYGIIKVAKIFSQIQEARQELLAIATKKKPIDKQDLLLATMLEEMKDSSKHKFSKITLMSQTKKEDLNIPPKLLEKDDKITITISAQSPDHTHKISITPSVAVNPPAIQYFKGIHSDYLGFGRLADIDNRFKQFTDFIVTCLSSDEYPNPPICSKRKALYIAKKHLPNLIKKLKSCQQATVSIPI